MGFRGGDLGGALLQRHRQPGTDLMGDISFGSSPTTIATAAILFRCGRSDQVVCRLKRGVLAPLLQGTQPKAEPESRTSNTNDAFVQCIFTETAATYHPVLVAPGMPQCQPVCRFAGCGNPLPKRVEIDAAEEGHGRTGFGRWLRTEGPHPPSSSIIPISGDASSISGNPLRRSCRVGGA